MIWVLTREINAYDQDGEYFVHAWDHKPTFQDLIEFVGEYAGYNPFATNKSVSQGHVIGNLLRSGGGRITDENEWFYLQEIK